MEAGWARKCCESGSQLSAIICAVSLALVHGKPRLPMARFPCKAIG